VGGGCMPRKSRVAAAGCPHHVTQRGAGRFKTKSPTPRLSCPRRRPGNPARNGGAEPAQRAVLKASGGYIRRRERPQPLLGLSKSRFACAVLDKSEVVSETGGR
jgi:hypothetical protein